jgi:nucleoside-diphosphate-sugar epimerase
VIVGSGLLAAAFASHEQSLPDVCVYAAGVSNSGCTDPAEFERDRVRLISHLDGLPHDRLPVYFSTCSILEPSSAGSAYVRHKLAMEDLVRRRPRHLILRLPQLAGLTSNPHTLLNYLYTRISRSEGFLVWRRAVRNIIDVSDVARITCDLLKAEAPVGETINIANPRSTCVVEIVRHMEQALHRQAWYRLVDCGSDFTIPVDRIRPSLERCGLNFNDMYVPNVIAKYYSNRSAL